MDDPVAVILAREVVERGLQRTRRLIERAVADRVHFDLQSGAVRGLAEIDHFFIAVIQHAVAAERVDVRFVHGRVVRAEAAVQRALEAAADARKFAALRDAHVHRLREHAQLESVAQSLCKQFFKRDIEIHRKPDAADRMHHADAARREKVHGILHVFHQIDERERAGNIVGKTEKRLLIHLARVGVIAAQILDLRVHFFKQL